MQELALSDAAFQAIARVVRQDAGIVLNDSKRNLVYGRLSRRLRQLGCNDFDSYLDRLQGSAGEAERSVLINAITTNLTGFFREPHHFERLSQILPELAARLPQGQALRLWSAACSSGEEPYSIAMTLLASLPAARTRDALVLATDIDTDMLRAGQAGRYATRAAQPIPDAYRRRFLRRAGGDAVEIAEDARRCVRFRPLNLLGPWPMRGQFDVIFCRNVVIYFDKPTQRVLFDRFADIMRPDGILFIGHSESLHRVSDRFVHVGRTAYRRLR